MSEFWQEEPAVHGLLDDSSGLVPGVWDDTVDGTLDWDLGGSGDSIADAAASPWGEAPEWVEHPETDIDPDWLYNGEVGG